MYKIDSKIEKKAFRIGSLAKISLLMVWEWRGIGTDCPVMFYEPVRKISYIMYIFPNHPFQTCVTTLSL